MAEFGDDKAKKCISDLVPKLYNEIIEIKLAQSIKETKELTIYDFQKQLEPIVTDYLRDKKAIYNNDAKTHGILEKTMIDSIPIIVESRKEVAKGNSGTVKKGSVFFGTCLLAGYGVLELLYYNSTGEFLYKNLIDSGFGHIKVTQEFQGLSHIIISWEVFMGMCTIVHGTIMNMRRAGSTCYKLTQTIYDNFMRSLPLQKNKQINTEN